jgi:lipopolysaccharide export system protein LptA
MSSIEFCKRLAALCLLGLATTASALETDRQQPLEVNADSTDGTLGDGITTLKGHVEIRQGSLLISADEAEVNKAEGKVRDIVLRGDTAFLTQEIEELGQVRAWAQLIEYQVGSGLVTFTGDAKVRHPQYEIRGDKLTYDLNVQHFQGNGQEGGNGRIHIRLDPEVATGATEDAESGQESADPPDAGDSGL